jgi:hypothetical protein
MSDNFDRLLRKPPLVGSDFIDSLALRPSFPRASLVPAPEDPKHPMEPRFALHAQAAAVPGAAPLGWDKDATDDDEVDNGPLTGAAARKELFRCLYASGGRKISVPSTNYRFSYYIMYGCIFSLSYHFPLPR